jgi:hypothetical protein
MRCGKIGGFVSPLRVVRGSSRLDKFVKDFRAQQQRTHLFE